MSKFKVGDRLVVSSGPWFSKGTLVTVVATDDDDHMPYLCYDGKTKLWVNEDDLGPASEADKKPEFHVGQRVRIRLLDSMKAEFGMDDFGNPNVKFGWVDNMNSLCGRTATISSIDGKYVKLKDWNDSSGDTGWCFSTDMLKPAGLEAGQIYRVGKLSYQHGWEDAIIRLTEKQEDRFKVKSIRGEAPLDFMDGSEYARSLTLLTGQQIGEAIKKYDADHAEKKPGVKEVKRNAEVGEWIKVITGDGHRAPVGGIFRVVKKERLNGWIKVLLTESGSTVLRNDQYVVLEGYKPEQKGKHVYTADQIEQAKKLCGEMMAEAFDDGDTFSLHFVGKNYSKDSKKVSCELTRFNGAPNSSGTAVCSDHDEYNAWIGRCVAFCRALHKPVPEFIVGG